MSQSVCSDGLAVSSTAANMAPAEAPAMYFGRFVLSVTRGILNEDSVVGETIWLLGSLITELLLGPCDSPLEEVMDTLAEAEFPQKSLSNKLVTQPSM